MFDFRPEEDTSPDASLRKDVRRVFFRDYMRAEKK